MVLPPSKKVMGSILATPLGLSTINLHALRVCVGSLASSHSLKNMHGRRIGNSVRRYVSEREWLFVFVQGCTLPSAAGIGSSIWMDYV